MQPVNPLTDAARAQALALAKQIAQTFPDHWGAVPQPFLALKVREWMRQIEDSDIWEPEHVSRIVTAVFAPAPELVAQDEMDYVMAVLSNGGAGGEARSKAIAAALPRKSGGE